MILAGLFLMIQPPHAMPGEEPVDPYTVSDSNAGAKPYRDDRLFRAFNGRAGIERVVRGMLDRSAADPRTAEIFKATDMVRLRRTLGEQFCYLLGGGCTYSGRDMKAAHKDLGLQAADMNALVEHLQHAMDAERIPFSDQNKLLAKLAPMKKDVVER
jgi:hemoglobin